MVGHSADGGDKDIVDGKPESIAVGVVDSSRGPSPLHPPLRPQHAQQGQRRDLPLQ